MKIDQITFTRFIAALSIVIYHYGMNVFPFNSSFISFLFEQANIGVSYFFLLSGFVMIIAYGRKASIKTSNYLKNRFARIYPVYLFAIILECSYQLLASTSFDTSGLLLNGLFLQAWIPGKALSFNSPGWSLSVEFFFYAIFPLIFNFVYSKINYKKIIIPFLLIWIISQVFFHIAISSDFYNGSPSVSHDILFYFPLMHLNEFLIGNIAGLFYINQLKGKQDNFNWYVILLIIAFIVILKYNSFLNFHNGLLSVIFIPLIFLISLNTGIISKVLKKKTFVFLGEISYGIYILQMPIFSLSRGVLRQFLHIYNESLIFYISLIILLIVSSLSYIFIEVPLRHKIRNFNTT